MGAGGSGIGGAATKTVQNGNDGSTNTGSGGGGTAYPTSGKGGNGGSGIVILRYADTYADLTGIGGTLVKTGGGTSPTTVTGGYKIYVFTGGTGTVTV
jgi:hypothetical protein